jgi:hypothetical protein
MKGLLTMKLFYFDCFAVLTLDTNDDCDDPEIEKPELRGFWATREEAYNAAERILADRRAHFENEFIPKSRQQWPGLADPKQSTMLYVVVPLAQVEADDLADLEEKLQQAAALMLAGIGKDRVDVIPETLGWGPRQKTDPAIFARMDEATEAADPTDYIFAFESLATGTLMYAVASDPERVGDRKNMVQMRGPQKCS